MFKNQGHQHVDPAEIEIRERWYKERGLLDMFTDTPAQIIAFIQGLGAADLHQFNAIHGVEQEIEIYSAILDHPKLDRATALNIFMACDPQYYDTQTVRGVAPPEYDEEEDHVFVAIATKAHALLCSRKDWPATFRVLDAAQWAKRPNSSPVHYKHFTLPVAALAPSANKPAPSAIIYEYSTIGLAFDVWRMKN